MSDEEVEKMIKDAEAHAEEDRKMKELVDARNQADSMIHATEKSLKDLADQVEEAEKKDIEAKIEDLRTAVVGDDLQAIEEKRNALTEVAAKLAERAYAKAQQEEGGDAPEPETAEAGADDVVDAEFEEVKDDEKKINH